MSTEAFITFGVLLTEAHYRIQGILIWYRATSAKLDELSETKWFDPKDDRLTNKYRMKELGAALFSYRRFLTEMTISAIAIAVESLFIEIKRVAGVKIDLWDARNDAVRYITEARKASALHNVIKHNQGEIRRAKSTSAKFLVDQCGFKDGQSVENGSIDIERLLFCIYVFSLDLIERVAKVSVPILKQPESVIHKAFESLIPNSLGLISRRLTST